MSHPFLRARSLAVAGLSALSLLGAAASTAAAAVDTQLPTPPGQPTLTIKSTSDGLEDHIYAWSPATDNVGVVAYHVYNYGTLATTVPASTPSWTVHTFADSGEFVTVTAVDARGNESAASAQTYHYPYLGNSGTDVDPPSTPGTPVVRGISPEGTVIAWTRSTDDYWGIIAGYDVYNGTTKIASVTGSGTSVTWPGRLDASQPYSLTVVARDRSGHLSTPSAPLTLPGPADAVAPTAPTAVTKSGPGPFVLITWSGATDNLAVDHYDVYNGGSLVGRVAAPTTRYVLTLPYDAGYSVVVKAVDAAGNASAASPTVSDPGYPQQTPTPLRTPTPPLPTVTPTPTPSPTETPSPTPTATTVETPTPSPTKTPTPTPGLANYGFTLNGSMSFKTLTTGSVATTGVLNLQTSPAGGGTAYAKFSLALASAKLTALGVLPVVAKIQLVPTVAPASSFLASGRFTSTSLAVSTKARLKVVSATVFGAPIVQGNSCQTSQPSALDFKSTGAFSPSAGGTLAASFSLSNLSGCGSLTGLVSPVVTGSGNSLVLNLTPGPLVVFPG